MEDLKKASLKKKKRNHSIESLSAYMMSYFWHTVLCKSQATPHYLHQQGYVFGIVCVHVIILFVNTTAWKVGVKFEYIGIKLCRDVELGHVNKIWPTSTEVFEISLMIYWLNIDKKRYKLETQIITSVECMVNISSLI